MKKMEILVKAILVALLFLGIITLLFDAYTQFLFKSALTPLDTTFENILPGRVVTEDGLNADFFCAESEQPRKAIIILGGSEGGKHWSTNTRHIQALLDRNYCVMVLAYFNAPGISEYLREIPFEYFERAFRWLAGQEQIIPDEYAVVGISRGAELALLLASRYTQIKAIGAIVPASVVFPGSPQSFIDVLTGQHSAWSYQGKPLPYVPWSVSLKNAPGLVTFQQRRMFEQALRNDRAVSSAAIAVENVNGPILCVSTPNDEVWPSDLMCDQIMQRLAQNKFPFHYEHITHEYSHGWCGLDICWGSMVKFLDENFK